MPEIEAIGLKSDIIVTPREGKGHFVPACHMRSALTPLILGVAAARIKNTLTAAQQAKLAEIRNRKE